MADFVQNSQTKNAVRVLANPIQDAAALNAIVESVIADNPFGCAPYMTAGQTRPGIEKARESYTARFVYEDGNAKTIGIASHRFSTLAGLTAGIAAVLADAAVTGAHGGTATRNTDGDTYSITLRCHDPNGELYQVNFSRDRITLTSYSDEAIRTRVEAWADTIPALA